MPNEENKYVGLTPEKQTAQRLAHLESNRNLWKGKEALLLEEHGITKPLAELPAVVETFQNDELLLNIKGQGASTLSLQVGNESTVITFIVVRNYFETMHQLQMFQYSNATIELLLLWMFSGKTSFACKQILGNYIPLNDINVQSLMKKEKNNKAVNASQMVLEYNKNLPKEHQIHRALQNKQSEGWIPYSVSFSAEADLVTVGFAKNILLNSTGLDEIEGIALQNVVYKKGIELDTQEMIFAPDDIDTLIYFGILNPEDKIAAPNDQPVLTPVEYFSFNFAQKYGIPMAGVPKRFIKDVQNWTQKEQDDYKEAVTNTMIAVDVQDFLNNFEKPLDAFTELERFAKLNSLELTVETKEKFIQSLRTEMLNHQQDLYNQILDDYKEEVKAETNSVDPSTEKQ